MKGGGLECHIPIRRLMAKTILNFHFDYLTPSLREVGWLSLMRSEFNICKNSKVFNFNSYFQLKLGTGGCHTGKVAVSRGGYLGNVEQHFGWNPQSLKSWSISLFSSPCQPLSACPALPWVLNALIISTGPSPSPRTIPSLKKKEQNWIFKLYTSIQLLTLKPQRWLVCVLISSPLAVNAKQMRPWAKITYKPLQAVFGLQN